MQKVITEREIELINNSCCDFIFIYCMLNGIRSEEDVNKIFNKMYNDELIFTFMAFKETFYPNTEMDEQEYLAFQDSVIVETYGEETLKKYLREHNRELS